MTKPERAAQIWPLLVMAARSQQVVSYSFVEHLTGIPKRAVGDFLGPIQEYCRRRDLPPITALVVKEDTGLPGSGFTAATDVFAAQARVFVYDWMAEHTPQVEEFEAAMASAA